MGSVMSKLLSLDELFKGRAEIIVLCVPLVLTCVVDVSELGSSAAHRRFMAAFAESL
jgi:hypothetical protein